ncbi:hypothetical protein POMI540_4225 [Schizosaccharomyces pombe]
MDSDDSFVKTAHVIETSTPENKKLSHRFKSVEIVPPSSSNDDPFGFSSTKGIRLSSINSNDLVNTLSKGFNETSNMSYNRILPSSPPTLEIGEIDYNEALQIRSADENQQSVPTVSIASPSTPELPPSSSPLLPPNGSESSSPIPLSLLSTSSLQQRKITPSNLSNTSKPMDSKQLERLIPVPHGHHLTRLRKERRRDDDIDLSGLYETKSSSPPAIHSDEDPSYSDSIARSPVKSAFNLRKRRKGVKEKKILKTYHSQDKDTASDNDNNTGSSDEENDNLKELTPGKKEYLKSIKKYFQDVDDYQLHVVNEG